MRQAHDSLDVVVDCEVRLTLTVNVDNVEYWIPTFVLLKVLHVLGYRHILETHDDLRRGAALGGSPIIPQLASAIAFASSMSFRRSFELLMFIMAEARSMPSSVMRNETTGLLILLSWFSSDGKK